MSSWLGTSYYNTASSTLSTGAIIGIVVGCLGGLALVIGIIITIYICCKKKTPVVSYQQQGQQPMGQQVYHTGGYGQGQGQGQSPQYYQQQQQRSAK